MKIRIILSRKIFYKYYSNVKNNVIEIYNSQERRLTDEEDNIPVIFIFEKGEFTW